MVDYRSIIKDFNPRSPWGERLELTDSGVLNVLFQSTLPVGGATHDTSRSVRWSIDFNPRSPWGERLPPELHRVPLQGFQSTLPVGGAT